MLNEKESPGDDTDRKLAGLLKSVARDVVIPSLNSPGNVTVGSPNEKTSNTHSNGSTETRSSNIRTNYPCDHQNGANQTRDHSSQSREQSNKSRDVSCGSWCQNLNTRETHAATTHEASETNVHNKENLSKTENNSQEKNYQPRGSIRQSSLTRDSVTRQPRDIGTCLNTLDYLKAVLQSTMVNFSWLIHLQEHG